MKKYLTISVLVTVAVLLWSCAAHVERALVHRESAQAKGASSGQFGGGYVSSWSGGAHTGYKLHGVVGELPTSHAEFAALPTYPQTHSVWMNPELMQQAGARQVKILLGSQRGLYLVNGLVAMDFPVCTGRGRKRTPTGNFSILQKHIDHHSNLYDCPMPYFMRLTWCGVGLHVGDIYRRPASHGCIRLPRVACEPLYRALPCGSKVQICE
ncbi:MAG: L,D-transpeptidase family protein [Akkermansia sp.]|nr:L,D-transpeptidase family protein [Akkermansia sp.]